MRRILTVLAGLVVLALVGAAPAAAITGGRPDGNAHPYVGIVLTADGALCSGSLLSPTVFLTAGHCTYYFTESGADEVFVSFDSQVTADSEFITASTSPAAGSRGPYARAATSTDHPVPAIRVRSPTAPVNVAGALGSAQCTRPARSDGSESTAMNGTCTVGSPNRRSSTPAKTSRYGPTGLSR